MSAHHISWTYTLRVPVPSGEFPRQARALISASPYLRSLPFSPGSSTYEGEAVDAVTPAGLLQEPKPYEEVKLWYTTSMSVSTGPGGGFRRGLRSLARSPSRSQSFSRTYTCSSRCTSLTLRRRVPLPGPAVWTHGGVEEVFKVASDKGFIPFASDGVEYC